MAFLDFFRKKPAPKELCLAMADQTELRFQPVEKLDIDLQHYIQIPVQGSLRDNFSQFSQLSGHAVDLLFVHHLTSAQLFRATAPIEQLMRYSNGLYSSIVQENGKILSHAGFQAVGTGLFVPFLLFKIGSILFGQYHLMKIHEEMKKLNQKVDRLLELHKTERIAKLRYAVKTLEKMTQITAPQLEDLLLLKTIESDVGIIFEEAAYELSRIDPKRLMQLESFFTSNKIKELLSKIESSDFEFCLKTAIAADEVSRFVTLVYFIVNTRMPPDLQRFRRIHELIGEIKSWNSEELYRKKIQKDENVARFFSVARQAAWRIYRDAILHEKDVLYLKENLSNKEKELWQYLESPAGVLEFRDRFLQQLREPEEILYLMDPAGHDRILVLHAAEEKMHS